ncbi:MAG TPA: Holliday junction resolvase RuvX [Acidimicrobiia bacterium]|nr:Holliday junction resolvase RuvX [Acidimicrobiia bacterium]
MSRALGVDYGTKRVGLAISDSLGITARPLSVVPRSVVVEEVVNLVKEHDVGTIVVGLPTGLSGDEGVSASEARKLADELGVAAGVDVVLVDERYTSRLAEDALLESGMKRRKRRESVDKVAAAIILQDYLDRTK